MLELRLVQADLFTSAYCDSCPARGECGARHTQLGCSEFGPPDDTVLHFLGADWLERYVEVNTFEFNVTAHPADLPKLPDYIPIIRPNGNMADLSSVQTPAVAVPLSHVERLARRVRRSGRSLRQMLGMSKDQLIIVLGFEHDRYLETIWPESRRARLVRAIAALDPDMAVAWNYSVWHRHASGWLYPRAEQLYNLKRSLKIYAELQENGVPAVPHIYWGVPRDIDRWCEWLGRNPSVALASIDLQTLDSTKSWRRALDYLSKFRQALGGRHLHLLFSGTCSVSRVLALKRVWPDSSLANQGAYFGSTSLRYKRCYGLERPWLRDQDMWTSNDVFDEITRQYGVLYSSTGSIPRVNGSVA
jgi:hypothetical protein